MRKRTMQLKRQHTHRLGIQRKVIISILVSSLVALMIGLFVTYREARKVLTKSIGSNFTEIAKKTAERVSVTVMGEITTFQHLAEDPVFVATIKENRRGEIKDYLARYLRFHEEREKHVALFVVNKRGEIIASGDLTSGYSADQSNERWWKVTYSGGVGRLYASNIYIDESTGNRVFDIGIPVMDGVTGKVVGGIRDVINVELFFRFIKEMNFARTGHGMLVDSEGTPLICPILPLVEHSMNKETVDLVTGKGAGWAIAEDDAHGGRNSAIGFSPIEYINSLGPESLGGTKWYTFVRQDPKETFAPVNSLVFKILLFEAGIVLLICMSGVYIVRRFLIKPIDVIYSGVEEIGAGGLGHRIDLRTGDEFESLAKGFNRMSEVLRELYTNLEGRIHERTVELERTKKYLEGVLRYSGDMIITTDLDARIITFNEGAERILGYRKEEVIGTFIADYYCNKEERARLLDMVVNHAKMVTNYETQLVRKDGKAIDISLTLSQLRDEEGIVIGTVGISKDITEWKLAQQKLKEYSQRLESMVEQRTIELEESKSHLEAMLGGIADAVVFSDQNNRITFMNDAAEAIFKIKRGECLSRDFKDCHSDEAHEKSLQLIKEMREGRMKSYTTEIKASEKIISAHFSPIMHGSEYLGVIFIARDITETKRLQMELETSETRYRDLVEHSPEMIHSVNEERYFLDVNKTELDTLGYTLEEMRRRRIEDIVADEYKEKAKRHIERVIREGRSTVEVQFVTKAGDGRDVEISATALYHPTTGDFVRTRAFVRDITEIKRLQRELLQAEKLAVVGKMSSTIAHELRNPLVPIGGFARLLSKKIDKDPSLKKYADVIIGEIDRLEKLLHDFLYFTKVIKPVLQPVNLNEIINDLLLFYNVTFTDKNIVLDVRLSPEMPLTLLDPSEVRQALINIITNAIHAMPEGGTLTVEGRVEEREGKPYISVSITDTGGGITRDLMKNIFEPFFTTNVHGLGLGLTLTKNIVEAHSGSIEVRSKEGKGSTFIISLPLHPAP